MAEPWEPFPMPLRGEPLDVPLFLGMGRVVDHWERVEFGLSQLYSLFVGDLSFESMKKYGGNGNIFRDRLGGLREVADAFFRRSPSQNAEADFDRLVTVSKGYSDRRNEVAHAIVMDVQDVLFFKAHMTLAAHGVPQYLVIPPIYHVRKLDQYGLPAFAYSVVELERLCDLILSLEVDIDNYIRKLWPSALPTRGT